MEPELFLDKELFINNAKKNGWKVIKLTPRQIKRLSEKKLEEIPELYMFSKTKKSQEKIINEKGMYNYLIDFILDCVKCK